MTDLIPALADQIVALINASPRSPAKEQIEELIESAWRASLAEIFDAGMLGAGIRTEDLIEELACRPRGMSAMQALVEDYLAKKPPMLNRHVTCDAGRHPAECITGDYCSNCRSWWNPKSEDKLYRAEAAVPTKALIDAMNTSVYGGPTVEDREKFWANKLNDFSSVDMSSCPTTHMHMQHEWIPFDKDLGDRDPHAATHWLRCCICGAEKPA